MTTVPERGNNRDEERRCTALNRRGEPCRSTSVDASGLCAAHRPGADMVELGRRAGLARGANRRQQSEPQNRMERMRDLMWSRFERMLADENTGDTAAMKAVTVALDRFEPMFRDESARQARRALAEQFAGVVAAARRAAEQGDCALVLVELDRAHLDGAEPVVYEYETDPARMLDALAEVGLIHRVRPVKQGAE
jgi:hypothetical protein